MKPSLKRSDSTITPSSVTPTSRFIPASGLLNTSTSGSNAVNLMNGNISESHDKDRYNERDNYSGKYDI